MKIYQLHARLERAKLEKTEIDARLAHTQNQIQELKATETGTLYRENAKEYNDLMKLYKQEANYRQKSLSLQKTIENTTLDIRLKNLVGIN